MLNNEIGSKMQQHLTLVSCISNWKYNFACLNKIHSLLSGVELFGFPNVKV